MKRLIIALAILILMLSLSSCVSNHYLVEVQYINANTGKLETIDVPMSQYHYDNTNVGDSLEVTIKTIILGIRVPITDRTSSGGLALAEVAPIMIPLLALFFTVLPALNDNKQKGWLLKVIIPLTITFGIAIFFISTTAPEFTVIGQVIDKTSGVW